MNEIRCQISPNVATLLMTGSRMTATGSKRQTGILFLSSFVFAQLTKT
jgi:hypothetical protein